MNGVKRRRSNLQSRKPWLVLTVITAGCHPSFNVLPLRLLNRSTFQRAK